MKKFIINRRLLIVLLVFTPVILHSQTKKAAREAFLHYVDRKYDLSFKDYSELVKYGSADAFNILAEHYYYGLGVSANQDIALDYYKKAADIDDRSSQSRICEILYEKDPENNSAIRSDLYKYSRMYCTNFEWESSSGRQEDIAFECMYLCYQNGWGVSKNPTLADAWLAYGAWNESSHCQDTFCEKYNINGNYNSDEEESALFNTFFKHLYVTVSPYLSEDNSVENHYFKMYYNALLGTTSSLQICANEALAIYKNQNTPDEGKLCVLAFLKAFNQLNASLYEKYSKELEQLSLVTDEDRKTWEYNQMAKVMWKIDVILNSKTKQTHGLANNIEWVDLGLPSGTKWATKNIGSSNITGIGSLFAWGELMAKHQFSEANYMADKKSITLDEQNDVSRISYGAQWNTPSIEDWSELFKYCDIEYDNFSKSICFHSPNKESLTIPLVLNSDLDRYIYWTNTKASVMWDFDQDYCVAVSFTPTMKSINDLGYLSVASWLGCPIRPVYKQK